MPSRAEFAEILERTKRTSSTGIGTANVSSSGLMQLWARGKTLAKHSLR